MTQIYQVHFPAQHTPELSCSHQSIINIEVWSTSWGCVITHNTFNSCFKTKVYIHLIIMHDKSVIPIDCKDCGRYLPLRLPVNWKWNILKPELKPETKIYKKKYKKSINSETVCKTVQKPCPMSKMWSSEKIIGVPKVSYFIYLQISRSRSDGSGNSKASGIILH